ncbi:MAG TPA: hypothetical protein VM910_29955 [Bradyrhizobium sp.]|jgi:hypothetical protein|nr:hypothetical protein [Bradyrhizobium sp.]
MLDIVKSSPICNGNGAGEINGRGARRRKLTPEQRVSLAADIALRLTPFAPSIGQTAAATGVSPYSIRKELKARSAAKELKARSAAAERERQAEYSRQGALPIVSTWDRATVEGRTEAVRLIGPATVWDVLADVVG